MQMTDLVFTVPDRADIQQLKSLWADCFYEIPEAVNLIFDRYFDLFSAYCAKYGGKIVAALYLVGGSLNGEKAHYLCGAATLPDYRKKGIMSALIEYALNDAAEKGDKLSLLFPANDGLYSYYSKLGYVSACSAKRAEISRQQLSDCKINDNNPQQFGSFDFIRLQKECFADDFLLHNSRFWDFAAAYYGAYGLKLVISGECAALVDEEEDVADVIYAAYSSFDELKTFLLKSTSAQNFVFTIKSDNSIFSDSKIEKCGMIRPLESGLEIPENIYIGITLM